MSMNLVPEIYSRVMTTLSRMAEGLTPTAACQAAGIAPATFRKYVMTVPELQNAYGEAEQLGYDTLADMLLNIFDGTGPYGETDPKRARIISDNIKWYLSRKRPSQYGDRTIVETHITADKAIVEALARGRERAERAVIEDVAYNIVSEAPTKRLKEELPDELKQFL